MDKQITTKGNGARNHDYTFSRLAHERLAQFRLANDNGF